MNAKAGGSSPLARGLREDGRYRDAIPGIIPARAGFTRCRAGRRRLLRDHPRSRGVYTTVVSFFPVRLGSSPLARGLHHPPGDPRRRTGIIPARAGFTGLLVPGLRAAGDHPRSRGVYALVGLVEGRHEGSSPLARGLRAALDA